MAQKYPVEAKQATPAVVKGEDTAKERKVNFNLVMTETLHKRLSYYADNFAVGRKSSVTQIINTAIDEHLSALEKKAGIRK